MSDSNKDKRKFSTGVTLEPAVLRYLDMLAERTAMNRSWVINTVVLEYARLMADKNIKPLESREAVIHL